MVMPLMVTWMLKSVAAKHDGYRGWRHEGARMHSSQPGGGSYQRLKRPTNNVAHVAAVARAQPLVPCTHDSRQ